MRCRPIPFFAVFASCVFTATSAFGFENQIYLGGGLGVANYDRGRGISPAASLYTAYGISDSFDGRLELSSSLVSPEHASSRGFVNSALLGVTYKLDVIQLVPWAGLAFGVHQMNDALAGPKRSNIEPGASALFGLDYAFSREYGLSLAFGLHTLPFTNDSSHLALRYTTSLLRFERRFGW